MSVELGSLILSIITLLTLGGGLVRGYMQLSERIKVLEVLFEVFGRRAAKAIHSPHDPWGVDPLLDKYLDRNYELSLEEWKNLYGRMTAISEDPETSKDLIFAAEMLAAICMHKLFIPPPRRKQEV